MPMRGLSRVLDDVASEVLRECESIISRGLSDAEAIVEREKKAALERAEALIYQAEREEETIRSRSRSLAEVKARGVALKTMEEYLTEVINTVLERIREEAGKGGLKEDLKRLLAEAVEGLGLREVKAYTSPGLRPMLEEVSREVSKEKNVEIQVAGEVETAFGVVVKSPDESITYDNRVEERLERLRSRIRQEVASLLGV